MTALGELVEMDEIAERPLGPPPRVSGDLHGTTTTQPATDTELVLFFQNDANKDNNKPALIGMITLAGGGATPNCGVCIVAAS